VLTLISESVAVNVVGWIVVHWNEKFYAFGFI